MVIFFKSLSDKLRKSLLPAAVTQVLHGNLSTIDYHKIFFSLFNSELLGVKIAPC